MGSHRSKGRKGHHSRKKPARRRARASATSGEPAARVPGFGARLLGLFVLMVVLVLAAYHGVGAWWPSAGPLGRILVGVCVGSVVVSSFQASRLWMRGDSPRLLVGWSLVLCLPLAGPVLFWRAYRPEAVAPVPSGGSGPGVPDTWIAAGVVGHGHHGVDAGHHGGGGDGGIGGDGGCGGDGGVC